MTAGLKPSAADERRLRLLKLPSARGVPNNERYPAVLAKEALGGMQAPAAVCALFEANGWGGTWTSQVFDYHHFHPDAFEVLGVASGSARLVLGGPEGEELEAEAGDVILLPPGYGHKQIAASTDFLICGAYPPGQEDYSVLRAEEGFDEAVLRRIRDVPVPKTDPVWGGRGLLLKALIGG